MNDTPPLQLRPDNSDHVLEVVRALVALEAQAEAQLLEGTTDPAFATFVATVAREARERLAEAFVKVVP